MTKQEAAARLLVRRPGLTIAYVTSDAQAFEQFDLASLHAAGLQDGTVYSYVPGGLVGEMRVARAELGKEINRPLALEAKAGIETDAAAAEAAETLEGAVKGLGDAMRASELTGIDDPIVLTSGVEVGLEWAVLGAFKRSGLTLDEWGALSVQDLTDLVQEHIDNLTDGQ